MHSGTGDRAARPSTKSSSSQFFLFNPDRLASMYLKRPSSKLSDEFEVMIFRDDPSISPSAFVTDLTTGQPDYRTFHLAIDQYLAFLSVLEIGSLFPPIDVRTEMIQRTLSNCRNSLNARFHIPESHDPYARAW